MALFDHTSHQAVVSVSHISYSRTAGVETWITSDGRVYFVQLREPEDTDSNSDQDDRYEPVHVSDDPSRMQPAVPNGSAWYGTCLHDFPTPRWIQKQRRVDPDQPLHEANRRMYDEPKRAVQVALNSRFSVFAVGMIGLVFFCKQPRFIN